MDKERYAYLKFIDRIFPDLSKGLKVKVRDKRFKKGYYEGKIWWSYWSGYPFKIYIVRVWNEEKKEAKNYWVFRDRIEMINIG